MSLLIPRTSDKKYKQKSSVELLVDFLTDFLISYTSNKEYKQRSSMELLVYSLTDFWYFQLGIHIFDQE
jgi:hypothetical protein